MKQAMPVQSSFAMLFDPALARAAAEHAAKWDLPRYICRPLDQYRGSRVNSALAAYDAEVELAPVSEEEIHEVLMSAVSSAHRAAEAEGDADFEDDDI